ncbi:protein of unknown function DUF820 [[Leptolyngbya] sp. PCC 7376]|uniref:Uma2 family endonuclease n=1 Tax=[Leptolyngbya] sp. PCC 7376 TaxID=111781 RepID=UPI00029EFD92|nr:Uma2 family endonuclease [[Leptolyngbya] sp. PCC 7376]AFY36502.1 protein of unknown function DUF820 [[Leptolyngbya] sp. PCC 7376]
MTLVLDRLNYLQQVLALIQTKEIDQEQRFIVDQVLWDDYARLLEANGDTNQARFKYAHNQLEIMAPSSRHEFIKKAIGILLETYFLEKRIRFYPFGSTTFRSETQQKGIEPDQCYCLNSRKDTPDLAIEVVITSGGLNSLEIYRYLNVSEVWFWQSEKLSLYRLNDEKYQKIEKSVLLPDLDLIQFNQWILYDEIFDAVQELREDYR